MSWAWEEWKEGLPTRALQKIQELEGQLDKLKKERQQRQFQLESLEAALQKQKQKVENEKTEGTNLKRENQSLMEICENLEKAKQKISHELQVKESQVNFQEGQLNSSKKQIEKLEQELKRCKSELERSQQATQSADVSQNACITPQKIFPTPLTPSQYYSGSKYEDLKEKYNKEVEERKRLEAEVKTLQAKKASQAFPQNTMNHRDIARHQASSSVFSWQQEKTPSRLSSCALQTPSRRDSNASHFSGEQEVTPRSSTQQEGKREANSSFCDNSSSSHLLDQLKAQNQELRSKMNEFELRLQGQEKEMKGHVHKCQELQLQLEKAKVELNEKEKVLNKSRDELVRMTAQYDQASTKCTAVEQKLKKLTEDLSCQRQNAESARCSLEQKIKEKEKEFQEELSRQQRSFQTLDQECTQMKAKLTQELQQAKNTHNVLQAELDKVTSVKHQLEKNLEEFKQKFSRAEHALQASQTKENELRKSSEEMKKENTCLRSQAEQSAREVCHLQEELKKTKQSLSQSQTFAEETRAKNTFQETMLRDLQEKISQQENSLTLQKLELAIADLEKQQDCSQDLLKKREHHIEQLNEKLSKTQRESEALLSALEFKKKEYEELKEEKTLFSHWKSENEQLLKQMGSERESLQRKISHLETCLETQQIKNDEYAERVRILEVEKENLNVEMRSLRNMIDSRTVEVETQKQAYVELQQKAEISDQKHKKELENMGLRVSELIGQVEDLEHKLQLLSSDLMDKDQRCQDLRAEYESLQDRLQSSDSSLTNEALHGSPLAFEQQPAKNSFANRTAGQGNLSPEGSECRGEAHPSPKNSPLLQNRVVSLEFSLASEKQMNSDLQKQCEELVQIRGEIQENLVKAEQVHESFVAETSQRISKLQEDPSLHQNVVAETLVALENKERELQLLTEKLEAEQAEIQELKKSNRLLQESLNELQFLSEALSAEKKEMSFILSLNKKDIEELTRENETLKERNATLSQEKMNLLQKTESLSECIGERERSISDLSNQYMQEKLTLLQRCEEAGKAFEELSEKYNAVQEKSSKLEGLLNECTRVCENRTNELKQLKETLATERQEFVTKLALAEERNQNLIQESGALQQDLRSEIIDIQTNCKSEADGLKQEIVTLKTEHSKVLKEVSALLQENERLTTQLTTTKCEHQNLELGLVSNSVKEREHEINACHGQLPMAPEGEDTSLDSYNAQLQQLEAKIRNTELKLQKSEEEKESLQHQLRTIRALETANVQGDTQSRDVSGLKDCELDAEEKYISVLHELSTSQSDNAQLQCSLQTAMSKLKELEQMCDMLHVEKLELVSKLNDSRSECITAMSKMAEDVEKLVNEVKTLSDEKGLCQAALGKETPEGELGERRHEEKSVLLDPLDDSRFYEHLTLSNKEVQMHFNELQEKFSCLQSEHKILHDQHSQMSSKMSELQSCVDTLKAENSILSMSLRNAQGDSVKEGMLEPQEGHSLSLSFSCVADSPSLTRLGELSFYKDLIEQIGETTLLNNSEGNVSANQSNVEEVSCSSLEEENLTLEAVPSAPGNRTEKPETLCQMYLQSLKILEEKMERQEMMKNKEIEDLRQLLSSQREELDCLKEQRLSENEQWQQKLTSVTVEMEAKLAAEKKQTEHLSLELEAARVQLQGLDLSTRSLLGTDVEDDPRGGNDGCDIKESEESERIRRIETRERKQKEIIDRIFEQDIQEIGLELGSITETGAADLGGERSREKSPDTSCETPMEDKTQGFSERVSESSHSGPNALVTIGLPENQVTIQNLQLQVKETTNENLRLLHVLEECDKKVEILQSEIKQLDSKLNLQEAQLSTKNEICTELEKIVEELKKEKSDLIEKLQSFSCDSKGLCQRAEVLDSSSETDPNKLSHEVTEGSVANLIDSWRERFLDLENELQRVKSEKGSLEHHTHSLEADLEVVQTEKQCLEKDNVSKQQVITCLEEELSVVATERNRLCGELDTLSQANKELELMSEKMKEQIGDLESHREERQRHVEVLESEVKDKTQLLQTLSCDISELQEENVYLQGQLQSVAEESQALSLVKSELENQIGPLKEEKETLVKESESLQTKLSELELEKLTITKALETALLEKGEVAVRLSSTQEEVHQLRSGMEKLRVRIEADEKKQLRISETLKEREREIDSLQDKVESLERELQMSEENQETAILDAENAKAEVESLKTQMEALELDLVAASSEKENLTRQLQEKRGQLSELDTFLSSFKNLLEEKEQGKIQVTQDTKAAAEMLQTELKELNEEVVALCHNQATGEVREPQGPGSPGHQLRNGMERLRRCLEAEEKKQLNALGRLKDMERHAEVLKDRVESLESELETSRRNHEGVMLEAEHAKAELETLKAKLEAMAPSLRELELELASVRSEKDHLTKDFQKEQGRVSELETLNSSFRNLLQEKERMMEETQLAAEQLQTQLKELKEKLAALGDDQETWKLKEQNLRAQVDNLELEKVQLLQGLEEAKSKDVLLQSSVDGFIQEVADGKRKLEKKDEEISALKTQVQDHELLVSRLTQVEGELQAWKQQKAELENQAAGLEQEVQGLRSANDTLQDALEALQGSYRDLEKELELTKLEKIAIVEKVTAMTLKETELQREMQEVVQKTAELKEEFNREKTRLTEELNLMSEAVESSKGQLKELMLENGELKRSLDCAHKDQKKKQEEMREEVAEYQRQLQEAEKKHQAFLVDANKEHEMEIQTYREKLTSTEECLRSQKVEMDLLMSSKEELSNSLKATTETLEELKKTKMDNLKYAKQLKKDNECLQEKVKLLIKSTKQLEEAKEMLQKELSHLEEAAQEKQKTGAVVDANVDELMTKVKELKESLEEKSKEADEYLDKYCSLLISHEKLERAKETLETQFARLGSQQSTLHVQSSPSLSSVVPGSSPVPSVTETKLPSGQNKASSKRQRASGIRENGGRTASSTPERFSKKSRKAVKSDIRPAEPAEDTEFEPEGLPEVVKKGFADIPTGKTSPYVLRRTTMATRTSPRLAAQKLVPSPLGLHKENLGKPSKPTAGGSKSQKVKVAQQSPEDSGTTCREPTMKSPSGGNLPERNLADSPRESLQVKRGPLDPSPEVGPGSNENCKVQ